jgi:DNA-binding SARP family transcriptional activator
MTVLSAPEAVDLITTLVESHGQPAPAPIGDDPTGDDPTGDDPTGDDQDDAPRTPLRAVPASADGEPPVAANTAARTGAVSNRARITVLGPPRIDDSAAAPGDPIRPKSLELLVYLAVHGGSARVEAILEDLLPDAPARKAPARLHTYAYSLRKTLQRCAGPGTYLEHPAGRYALNPAAVDIDLWAMRAALAEADTAATPSDRIAALRQAVAAYRAPLADGCDYEWVEPVREAIRRQALDAHLALADALADRPADALEVLTAMMAHDPYAEAAYQHAMRAHAALGQPDAIRALRRTLARKLEEIDAEPGDDTLALADTLIAEAVARQRPAGRATPAAAVHSGRPPR